MRIRITFTKQGALRYTGNLDLHKLWERAARRAELPLAYSQGFHPQPKLNLAAALPLGVSSRCEMLDMRLEHSIPLDGLKEKLNATMPSGIQVLRVEEVDEGAPALQTQVVSAEYEAALTGSVDGSKLKQKIDSVMESESLPKERRGKSYDLRPLIEALAFVPSPDRKGGKIHMKLAAREGATGRPDEVLEALGIPIEDARVERTALNFSG